MAKRTPHAVFNYILQSLYMGCQWKQLPIEKDAQGKPEGSVAKFVLMNLESCRSLNLWSQFFDFARKTQLCDRTIEIPIR